MPRLSACLPAPPLTERLFRRRLETIHGRLHELEVCCPPEHAGELDTVLDVLETVMAGLGWQRPPLTPHDVTVLAALGCPA